MLAECVAKTQDEESETEVKFQATMTGLDPKKWADDLQKQVRFATAQAP